MLVREVILRAITSSLRITVKHFFSPTVDSPPNGTLCTILPPAIVTRHKNKKLKTKCLVAPINPLTCLDMALPLIQDMLFVAAAIETRCCIYTATHYYLATAIVFRTTPLTTWCPTLVSLLQPSQLCQSIIP
jgi:hypothetical protein